MPSTDLEQHIKRLREEIIMHDELYSEGNPIITDSEYDKLYAELVTLEQGFPEFLDHDSPTQRIYSVVMESLNKFKHPTKLLSLEKCNDEAGIRKFLGRFPDNTFVVQHKEDGLTINLHYLDGVLQKAVTRGDGEIGEDVTHSIMLIPSVPKFIGGKGVFEVRCEAIITFADFERVNTDGKYKSPRNLVSGSVRTLEAAAAGNRGVRLKAYRIIQGGLDAEIKDYTMLQELGFDVTDTRCYSSEDLIEYCTTFADRHRSNVDHMLDGLVITVNEKSVRAVAGETNKYPKWSIAFKFDSMDATTTIEDIFWTVGKTGVVVPNAVLEPVEIDGVEIQYASLANISNVWKRDIRIGDTVVVARANDVIPQVVSPVKELRTGEEKILEEPEFCPTCRKPLEKAIGKDKDGDDSISYFCINDECEAQIIRILQYFVSREAMNIDGLGDETVRMLHGKGFLRCVEDIYSLHERQEDLLKMDSLGKKKVTKMIQGIEASKTSPLSKIISSLGVRNIGHTVSALLANTLGSWSRMVELCDTNTLFDEVIQLNGIGSVLATDICSFVEDSRIRRIMSSLEEAGVQLVEPTTEEVIAEKTVEGLTFVITGSLSEPRKEIEARVKTLGGKVSGSVSKNTTYLVLGGYNDETGEHEGAVSSKHQKALDLGTSIISENKLNELLEG